MNRLDMLKERCTQFETTLNDTVTLDDLAARITGKKTVKRRRAMREWSPEEKKGLHERMVAALQAKEKNDSKLPRLKQRRNNLCLELGILFSPILIKRFN